LLAFFCCFFFPKTFSMDFFPTQTNFSCICNSVDIHEFVHIFMLKDYLTNSIFIHLESALNIWCWVHNQIIRTRIVSHHPAFKHYQPIDCPSYGKNQEFSNSRYHQM
jgi:hypothetical protein